MLARIPDGRDRPFGTAELVAGAQRGSVRFSQAAGAVSLSGRAIGKACRVARTIADLAGGGRGSPRAEALSTRPGGFGAPGIPRKDDRLIPPHVQKGAVLLFH